MRSYYLWVCAFLTFIFVKTDLQAQDTLQVLSLEEFHRIILEHHPVASQARLLTEQARQELRMSRGAFDPTVNSKLSRKEFGGKEYYNNWDNTLRVPLWFGPVLKAGYEKNHGQFLNPENTTPTDGLSYAGISVPLGQGLFIDERRATLKQAKLMQDIAEAERVKLINKLLLNATKDYWDWLLQYRTVQLLQESVKLADFRLAAVKARAYEGDLAAIDTVEALMAVQDRQVQLQQALLSYTNNRLQVEVHLWAENQVPLELKENTVPILLGSELSTLAYDSLQHLLQYARSNHPELRKLDLKGEQLRIEQRFAADKLKPKLNIDYNVLQSDFYLNEDALSRQFLNNNYKLGVSFSMPLLMRQERGKLQLTKAKRQANALELTQTAREIENEILTAYNEWVALEKQIQLQEQMVSNALILRNGEVTRFENGESSLFLINLRELKYIEAQVKLYELRAKYAKAKTYLYWAAGKI